ADWTKGYESTRPEDANAPKRDRDQTWSGPGTMAEAVKERWKGIPKPYPFGKAKDGGGGGGEGSDPCRVSPESSSVAGLAGLSRGGAARSPWLAGARPRHAHRTPSRDRLDGPSAPRQPDLGHSRDHDGRHGATRGPSAAAGAARGPTRAAPGHPGALPLARQSARGRLQAAGPTRPRGRSPPSRRRHPSGRLRGQARPAVGRGGLNGD